MSWHATEEDLVLHFYGEGRDREAAIDAHLHDCSVCRAAWTELGDTLKLVDSATVPEPDAGFERVMWARIRPALATEPWGRARWSLGWLVPLAGLAAVLIAAILLYGPWAHAGRSGSAAASVTPAASTVAANAARTRERALLTALDDHFEHSQLLLVELMDASESGSADSDFARTTAGDLVASGRLYRVTAQQNGDVQLARMLEDLNTVLLDVARGPDRITHADLESLRSRITDSNLLFKVRAVSNEIHERQRSLSSE